MKHISVPELLFPKEIHVKESYIYETELSRIKIPSLKNITGEITGTITYDRLKDGDLLKLENRFGYLKIKDYGDSNLNRQPEAHWDTDELPIRINPEDYAQFEAYLSQQNRFDLKLTHNYQPMSPLIPPLEVSVQILDEDYIRKHSDVDTLEKTLVDQLSKQMSLKRNLIIRFIVKLALPETLGQIFQENPPVISNMSLSWPIGTPHLVATVFADQFLRKSEPVLYNPEQNRIEWSGIPFQFETLEEKSGLYHFKTNRIRLEINEPAEIYENDLLVGTVIVDLNTLLSGMRFAYKSEARIDNPTMDIKSQSVLTNNFRLKLSEGLERKRFLPRQHLHFPGIIFNHMRLADIVMLLEDKGFELPSRWLSEVVIDNGNKNGNKLRRYSIEAERVEGARKLKVAIQVQCMDSSTLRERQILGNEKYTTPLPIGYTDIFIQGEMQGDPKYIIWEVNELQKQLKEQFGYVSTVG